MFPSILEIGCWRSMMREQESKTLEADTVVMSIGMRSNLSMKEALIGTGIEVYEIGSCKKPANIFKAVHDAFELIYNM